MKSKTAALHRHLSRSRSLRPYLLSALRIAVALSFLTHGTQKLFSWPVSQARPVADILTQTWFAGVLETFGGLLMLLGLFTRPVGFILSGQMAVAYFQAHWPRGFWPILNGGELAALYCFVFLYFAAAGGGPWSIDRWVRRR